MASALDIVFLSHHNSVWNFRLDHMRVSFIRLLQGFRVFTFYHFCSQVVPICFVVISVIHRYVIFLPVVFFVGSTVRSTCRS